MKATFLNEKGEERYFEMGCYGIGVSRIMAAAIEQNHDEKGIVWPMPIAPFVIHLLPIQDKSEKVTQTARQIYEALLEKKIEVLFDDRSERPGVKFHDADLLGAPYQVVIGEKNLKEGKIEIKERRTGVSTLIEVEQVINHLVEKISNGSKATPRTT